MPETPHQEPDLARALAATMGYFVDTVDGLRQHSGPPASTGAGQIFLRGYRQPGDGGEGHFLWEPNSTAADDDGVTINPIANGQTGRWVRMTKGAFVTPLWWGARFDDTADDSAPIQAAIDFAAASGGSVLLPPGTAKITRTLVLASAHGNHSGFRFAGRGKFGDSGSSMRDGSGTLIKYYGAANSTEAILSVDRSLWRYTTIADLSLLAVTPFAAKFGILFGSTEFSAHTVENVTVGFVKAAYGIVKGSGGNGEFTYFRGCDADQVGAFFYNNAGQAFTQRFEHCSCGLLPGGTYFVLDVTSGISPGGGLIVTDFDATGGSAGDPNPPTNTTLLHAGESMAPVSFSGGRIEHLTRLVDLPPNWLGLNIALRDMDITTDCDPGLPKSRVGSFITVRDNPAIISVSDCSIGGAHEREVLGIDIEKCRDHGPTIRFDRCIFGGFAELPKVIGARSELPATIRFTDCIASKADERRRHPLSYVWDSSGDAGSSPPRRIYAHAPPQQGTWQVGDQALNREPKAGGYMGWVCVTAGSPGEWRPFGPIA
ncbi:MAG TPA: hypothetical protein VH722_09925 [Alphaproteobacteria bacterium]|nr:hypothetical protein [Alphaproteobacteria bacterium]